MKKEKGTLNMPPRARERRGLIKRKKKPLVSTEREGKKSFLAKKKWVADWLERGGECRRPLSLWVFAKRLPAPALRGKLGGDGGERERRRKKAARSTVKKKRLKHRSGRVQKAKKTPSEENFSPGKKKGLCTEKKGQGIRWVAAKI